MKILLYSLVSVVCFWCTTAQTAPFSPIRINCGGSAYTDSLGRAWLADQYFTGGFQYSCDFPISGTVDDILYNCERYGASTYNIPVPPGSYTIILHFAEIFHTTIGARVFDVGFEGTRLISDIDILKISGGIPKRATTFTVYNIAVSDGFLTIRFRDNVPLIDFPKISAIEVRQFIPGSPTLPPINMTVPVATKAPVSKAPVSKAPVTKAPVTKAPVTKAPITKSPVTAAPATKAPVPAPVKVPVAKPPVAVPVAKAPVALPPVPVAKAPQAKLPTTAPTKAPLPKLPTTAPTKAPVVATPAFTPVRINCGGAAYNDTLGRLWSADQYFTAGFPYDTNVDISNTLDDSLYNCERYGHSTYSIPVPAGMYTVVLHFAEIYYRTENARVFDVCLEGQLIPDLDIVKLGGGVAFKAVTQVYSPIVVTDGFLTVEFKDNHPQIDFPKISAIEVNLHTAAVPTTAVTKAPVSLPVAPAPVAAPVVPAPVASPVAPVAKAPIAPSPVAMAPAATVPAPQAPVVSPVAPVAKAPIAPTPVAMAPAVPVPTAQAPVVPTPVAKAPVPVVPTPIARPPTLAPLVSPSFIPVLINCGGAAYVDAMGRQWRADQYFDGGYSFDTNFDILNTTDDSLYNCERYGQSTYSIPVPTGTYSVVLHFAEIYHAAVGSRVFDARLEGQFLSDIDIVKMGGGIAFKAVTRVIAPVTVADGFLTLELLDNQPQIDYPKISAIEINLHTGPTSPVAAAPTKAPVFITSPVAAPIKPTTKAPVPVTKSPIVPTKAPVAPTAAPVFVPPPVSAPQGVSLPFSPVLINCGGAAYNDTKGRLWSADQFFIGGATYENPALDVVGTNDDALYNCERYGPTVYSIPVPPGRYIVTLHFAEIYHRSNNMRIFDAVIEGQWRSDIDIVKLGGGLPNKVVTVVVPIVPVSDGYLTLRLLNNVPVIDLAKISAIEVHALP